MLEPLKNGRYRLLWLTGLCAGTARWMDVVVLGWLALADSPLMVGVAAFCRAVPMMALGHSAACGSGSWRAARARLSRRASMRPSRSPS